MKYSLERTVNPKTQSPGAGFFSPIAGYDEEASGKSTTLSGIEVVDDHTVKITLKEPNATFLHVLALNFARWFPVRRWRNGVPTSASIRSAAARLSSRSGSWARS
ncbi:ABC transporter substrate-binding protein [Escherichia coli]